MYTYENLKEDVRAEAIALKQHATEEEKANLNFEDLDSSSTIGCIYGQMTGNCYSKRAVMLINLCCKKVFGHLYFDEFLDRVKDIQEEDITPSHDRYFSSIEYYISLSSSNDENLINFLKGNTEDLDL